MSLAFFSDLHLTPDNKLAANKAFLKCLTAFRTQKNISELWLLGDIFDLLVGHFGFWERQHEGIFGELALLSRQGCRIFWAEGNHDFHLKAWQYRLGIQVFDGPRIEERSGKKIYLAHGDLVNTEDHAYLAWRTKTRSPFLRKILDWTPPLVARELLEPLGRTLSTKSRSKFIEGKRDPEALIEQRYRSFAEQRWAEGHTGVFLGHCHVADRHESKSNFYMNLGSWITPNPRLNSTFPYALWNPDKEQSPTVYDAVTLL